MLNLSMNEVMVVAGLTGISVILLTTPVPKRKDPIIEAMKLEAKKLQEDQREIFHAMEKSFEKVLKTDLQRGVLNEREIQNAIDGIVEYLRRKGVGEWWELPVFDPPIQARIVAYIYARLGRDGRIELRKIPSASGLSSIFEGRALAQEGKSGICATDITIGESVSYHLGCDEDGNAISVYDESAEVVKKFYENWNRRRDQI
jgi:hypothetical protein